MTQEQLAQRACDRALEIFNITKLKFRPMQKRGAGTDSKKSYILGRINLKTGLITIDIWTIKRREPKKISGILRVLAHEIAHYQKPPFRQRFRNRLIIRRHYPQFYKQVNRNIDIFKEDIILKEYFI